MRPYAYSQLSSAGAATAAESSKTLMGLLTLFSFAAVIALSIAFPVVLHNRDARISDLEAALASSQQPPDAPVSWVSRGYNDQFFWDPTSADAPTVSFTPSTNFAAMTTRGITSTSATIRFTNSVSCAGAQSVIARVARRGDDGVWRLFINKTPAVTCGAANQYEIPLTGLLPKSAYNYILQTSSGAATTSIVGRFNTFADELDGFWDPAGLASGLSAEFYGVQSGKVRFNGTTIACSNAVASAAGQLLVARVARRDPVTGAFVLVRTTPPTARFGTTEQYRFDLTGLSSSTEYNFFCQYASGPDTRRSKVGRFRTAPSPGAAPGKVRFALSGDYGLGTASQRETAHLRLMPQEQLDLHIGLGDMLYVDSYIGLEGITVPDIIYSSNVPWLPNMVDFFDSRTPNNLSEARALWNDQFLRSPVVEEALRATSVIVMADDHEVWNDPVSSALVPVWTGGTITLIKAMMAAGSVFAFTNYARATNQMEFGRTWWTKDMIYNQIPALNGGINLLEMALRVFDETIVNQLGPQGQRYYVTPWGSTADFITMDIRFDKNNGVRLMSEQQMAFVKDALINSKKPFKFLVTTQTLTWLSAGSMPNSTYWLDVVRREVQRVAALNAFTDQAAIDQVIETLMMARPSFRANGVSQSFPTPDSAAFYSSWNQYDLPVMRVPRQLDELYAFIGDNKINGTFFFGADYHGFGAYWMNKPFYTDGTKKPADMNLIQIVCGVTGNPGGNTLRAMANVPDSTSVISSGPGGAGSALGHCVLEADAVNHSLTIEFISNGRINSTINSNFLHPALITDRKVVLNLDADFNYRV